MNNLLRTLTESQVKSIYPESDLKLLLTTVKEGRRQSLDAKVSISDAFYDSLEGLLNDLKAVTVDNHDAEAFLKPVSKVEAPDYYDVIANPMDFATMFKKVKSKQYKSKREFKDDLELIWSNCLTYNAAENHPLRPCVKRLKLKADRLLKNITDRKERADPPIPSDIAATHIARPKLNGNGAINGRLYSYHRSSLSPSYSKSGTPTLKSSPSLSAKHIPLRDAPFPDTLAISRTPENMALFSCLDQDIDQATNVMTSSSKLEDTSSLLERLHDLAAPMEFSPFADSPGVLTPSPENVMVSDNSPGDKRKINGIIDTRPRKRARLSSQYPAPLAFETEELSELWWSAVQSDTLLANGLPNIPFSSSSSAPPQPTAPPARKSKPKKRKKQSEPGPKSLLKLMNNNIKTMKRLRHTHTKFSALNLNNNANPEDPDGGGGEGAQYNVQGSTPAPASKEEEDSLGVVDDKVDERSWISLLKGKGKAQGIEIGEANATHCVGWMGRKVLEHSGFQGASQLALDVLAGVTSEFLLNVGRTIRYLSDKYSDTMTPEEIILHTLFESGILKFQDLERYISDDVERYGSRLLDLEKKIVTAYRESTTTEPLEDEGLFEEEDEEDAGALAIGDFADVLGEDYLGLRELGIAAEFGLSNLSIPKKLLRRKKVPGQPSSAAAKPTEPPPPYPPPPPFIPLTAAKVEDQIGLLKPYFQMRFATLASTSQPPSSALPSLPGPSIPSAPSIPSGAVPHPTAPGYGLYPYPGVGANIKPLTPPLPQPPMSISPPPTLVLPDDPPNPTQVKMGPLGQIIKGGPVGTGSKKKKATTGPGSGLGPGGVGTDVGALPSKKKKGSVGVGTGNGRKKKLEEEQAQAQQMPLPNGLPIATAGVMPYHGTPIPPSATPTPFLLPSRVPTIVIGK